MKTCAHCGAPMEDDAVFCASCGSRYADSGQLGENPSPEQPDAAQQQQPYQQNPYQQQPPYQQAPPPRPYGSAPDDAPNGGFAVLCFFIPIVGLILYLTWKDQYPLKAKSCGKGALIGVIVDVVVGVCGSIFLGLVAAEIAGRVMSIMSFFTGLL